MEEVRFEGGSHGSSKTSKLKIAFVTTLILLVGCSTHAAKPANTSSVPAVSQARSIVIDTDMAPDDWMAILYLLQRPDVKVNAIIVTGAGETHCAPGVRHALGLTVLAEYDEVPVACGLQAPLRGDHTFPESWRESVDVLIGLTLPEGQSTGTDQTAAKLLASVLQSSPEKITLLTLGPLTNIAETLQNDPSLVNHIEMIYIMGGAVNVPGNVGRSGVAIDNDVAEWNIYVDPYAANIVLRSGAPVTLVLLDTTNQVPLNAKFYNRLKSNHSSPEATFVFDMLTREKGFIDSGGYFFWDPLAAAILTEESLGTFERKNICVIETEGSESGWTKAGNGCPEVRVAVSADGARFEQVFLDALNTASP